MTNNLPWFRFYPEALNDRKIQRVCLVTKQPKALVIGVWTTILALASDSPERGKLLISEDVPITLDEILVECGIADPAIVNAFEDLGMIYVENETFHVTNWNGRQFASDDSTARVRKHRAKKKAEPEPEEPKIEPESSENGTESPKVTLPTPKMRKNDGYVKQECNVSVTPPESDTESDTDKDSLPKGKGEKSPTPRASPDKSLEPETPEQLLVFQKWNDNRELQRRNKQKYFKTLQQKQKCQQAGERLGLQLLEQKLDQVLGNGATSLDHVINYIAKVDPVAKSAQNGAKNGHQPKQPSGYRPKSWAETQREKREAAGGRQDTRVFPAA